MPVGTPRLLAGGISLAVFYALAPLPLHCSGKPGAIVIAVQGEVLIAQDGGAVFKPLNVEDLLYAGDRIVTGAGSWASVALKRGAELRLNESSAFEFYPKRYPGKVLYLKTGQLWTRLRGKKGSLYVMTPTAICAIRGTEADINQRASLLVKVYEGHVYVRNGLGKRALAAGQFLVAKTGEALQAPRRMRFFPGPGGWQKAIAAGSIRTLLERLSAIYDEDSLKYE